jgi:hypothetical protein
VSGEEFQAGLLVCVGPEEGNFVTTSSTSCLREMRSVNGLQALAIRRVRL